MRPDSGSGIDIDGAMIAVTICITVDCLWAGRSYMRSRHGITQLSFHSDPNPALSLYPRSGHSHHVVMSSRSVSVSYVTSYCF